MPRPPQARTSGRKGAREREQRASTNQRQRWVGVRACASRRRFESPALGCGCTTSGPPSGLPSSQLRAPLRPPAAVRATPHPWPMAKRRAAEPLTFRVPWKRLLLSDFPEEPSLWVPPSGVARPLKRQGDAGTMAEPASAPRKRRGGGDDRQELQSCSLEPGEPPPGEQEEPRVSRAAGGGDRAESAHSQQGADGVHSQVRRLLSSPEPRPGGKVGFSSEPDGLDPRGSAQ